MFNTSGQCESHSSLDSEFDCKWQKPWIYGMSSCLSSETPLCWGVGSLLSGCGMVATDTTREHHLTSLRSSSTHCTSPLPIPKGRVQPLLINSQMFVSALLELGGYSFSSCLECPSFLVTLLSVQQMIPAPSSYWLWSCGFSKVVLFIRKTKQNKKKTLFFPPLLFSFICIDCIY